MGLSGGQNLVLSTPIAVLTGTDSWYTTVDTNNELDNDQKNLHMVMCCRDYVPNQQ